jgi:hypothetical protein
MYSFSDFLAERKTITRTKSAPVMAEPEEDDGSLNDDKGKLAEIALAHHLGKHLVNDGERYYPSHYRGEARIDSRTGKTVGGTPQQVESGILGRRGQQQYESVDRHSGQTADALIEHLVKTGRLKSRKHIKGVHWTSNADTATKAGDHEKLTKIKDPNQKGDLIISADNGKGGTDYIPVSSKYGSQAEPNYAGWGLDRIGKEAGMGVHPETGLNPLEQMKAEQEQELEQSLGKYHGSKAGGVTQKQKHALFKKDRAELTSEKKRISAYNKSVADHEKKTTSWKKRAASAKAKGVAFNEPAPVKPERQSTTLSPGAKRAQQAYDIGLKHRRRMADTLAAAINKKVADAGHDGPIRDWITKAISEPTKHKTVIAHSHTDKNNPHGESNSVVYDQDDVAPHVLNQYEGLQARVGRGEEGDEGDGAISVHFYGKHKKTGQWERVATQDLKAQNGPYQGTNGAFKIQNSKHQEEDQSNEAVPQNHHVADSQSGEPVEVDPHVPDSATIDSPAARRKQRYRASLQQTAADTGGASESPFLSRQKPGIAGFKKFSAAPEQTQQATQAIAQRPNPGIKKKAPPAKPIDPHEHKQYISGEHGGLMFRGPGDQ